MISRRALLRNIGAGAFAASLPRVVFARAETDARLVLVILRGAMDGLALVAPYGEGRYKSLRGELALEPPGAEQGLRKLDGLFGLHPSLEHTFGLYRSGQASIVHAAASPYRERSHFDGQDVLENGMLRAGQKRDGWLNRALSPLGGRLGHEAAIALSQNTPLVLRGANSTISWAPSGLQDPGEDTLQRIAALYAQDEFFATRLAQALESQRIAEDLDGMQERRRGNDTAQTKALMQSAARFLATPDGPQIAVIEASGWDTHANQGSVDGGLSNSFAALDRGLRTLQEALGETWSDTVVLVVTEFGRTVRTNGTRGTDHGTASAALIAGGAVAGGRIVTDWPGLGDADLYDGRDLYPTTDLRSVFKGVLAEHLGIAPAFLEREVFPDSGTAQLMEGLVRT